MSQIYSVRLVDRIQNWECTLLKLAYGNELLYVVVVVKIYSSIKSNHTLNYELNCCLLCLDGDFSLNFTLKSSNLTFCCLYITFVVLFCFSLICCALLWTMGPDESGLCYRVLFLLVYPGKQFCFPNLIQLSWYMSNASTYTK